MGLETGVPWTGGEGHGEPSGDTLEGGNPVREQRESEHDPFNYFDLPTWTFCFHLFVLWLHLDCCNDKTEKFFICGPQVE